jgi:hypothetical protein
MKGEILHARQSVIDAYERHTGFHGIGRFFQEQGLIIIADEERSCPE